MQQVLNLATNILNGIAVVLVIAMIIGGIVFWRRGKIRARIKEDNTNYSGYDRVNSTRLVPFEDIRDNMIIAENGTRFIGAIRCQGFDLYDEDLPTQAATCGRYMGFINTITKPITYRQFSKPVDIENQIDRYKAAYEKVEAELYNIQEDLHEISSHLNKNLSMMSEEEAQTYRKHVGELERKQEALQFRAFHIKDQLRALDWYSNSEALTTQEETYVFDWKYNAEDFSADLTKEEIHKRARQELDAIANAKIHALGNCNVRATRCDTASLIDQCRWYAAPRSSARYKLKDIMKSAYFDDILTSSSLHNLQEAAVQAVREESELEFMKDMKESAQEAAMRAIHALEDVYADAVKEEARLAAGGKLDKKISQKSVSEKPKKDVPTRKDDPTPEDGGEFTDGSSDAKIVPVEPAKLNYPNDIVIEEE